MQFKLKKIPISKLLLDPNNYRFLDSPIWKRKSRKRFHDISVQEATLRFLEQTPRYQLGALKNSILANGYVSLERIVVIPYTNRNIDIGDLYLIVEGNRRVAALKTLLRDHKEGSLTLSVEQIKNFSKVPAALLDPEEEGPLAAHRILMGIRHIAGPMEWGAYQQAQLIYELVEEEGQDLGSIAEHLGISKMEAHRRNRAIRALKEMESDEIFSDSAKPGYYRLFHELISLPEVRTFFGWNHEKVEFEDISKARRFFELITPQDPEGQPKLRTYADVRNLKRILPHKEAVAILVDPDSTLAEALSRAATLTSANAGEAAPLARRIEQFTDALQKVEIEELRMLGEEQVQALEDLMELIQSRIEDYNRLSE